MSELSELVKALKPEDKSVLRQGVVTATPGGGLISVKWGNSSVASTAQRYLASYSPTVSDSVWGISDGDVILVLGKLA